MNSALTAFNPDTELLLEREIDLPREVLWKAWTDPKLLMQWFCPKPWQVVECELDVRPGGKFQTVMQSPDGQKFPNNGCYLSVTKNEELIWSDTLVEGFRPSEQGGFFTGALRLEDRGGKTHYSVRAMHRSSDDAKKHAEMGFSTGWNKALDQMIELMKKA